MPRYRAVIFVHGCFWHQHPGCKVATIPKSRTSFWVAKFAKNTARDKKNSCELRKLGWKVFVVWECEVMRNPAKAVARIVRGIAKTAKCKKKPSFNYSCLPGKSEILKAAEKKLEYRLTPKL